MAYQRSDGMWMADTPFGLFPHSSQEEALAAEARGREAGQQQHAEELARRGQPAAIVGQRSYDSTDPAAAAAAQAEGERVRRQYAPSSTAAQRAAVSNLTAAWQLAGANRPEGPAPGTGATAAAQAQRDYLRALQPDQSLTTDARRYQIAGREQQERALGDMARYARGEESIAAQRGLLEQEALRKSIMSQLAGGTRFDPGTQHAAYSALGDAQAQLGARTALAAAQERQEALGNYVGALTQSRAQDLQRMGLESGQEQGLRQYQLGREQLGLGYEQLGTADRQYGEQVLEGRGREDRARIDAYLAMLQGKEDAEAARKAAVSGTFGSIFGTLGGAALGMFAGPGGAAAGGAAGGAGGAAAGKAVTSDRGAKTDITRGSRATREALDAIASSGVPGGAAMADTGRALAPPLSPQPSLPRTPGSLPVATPADYGPLYSQTMPAQRPPWELAPAQSQGAQAQPAAQKPKGMTYDDFMLVGALANAFGGLGGQIGQLAAMSDSRAKRGAASGSTTVQHYLDAIASDRRGKQSTASGDPTVRAYLEALQPYTYEYRPGVPGAAPGRQLGVMAQDVERGGPIGQSLVMRDPQSGLKAIGLGPQMQGATMAALGNLHQRLERLEGGR